jgi:hypothetical protein
MSAMNLPTNSSMSSETFRRYHKDLINADRVELKSFLSDVRCFKVKKPVGWYKHISTQVKLECDIKDDTLRKVVVETVMKYKSAELVRPHYKDRIFRRKAAT